MTSILMSAQPTRWSKMFGSGPAGVLVSVALFFGARWIDGRIGPVPLSSHQSLLNGVFLTSVLLTLGMVVWSVRSLPTAERGNRLSTRGAYQFVRHPLYAAFLSIFNFGLAVHLNSYVFIAWAVLLHPVWHGIVRREERLMVDLFGQAYVEYQARTGRFFPRLRWRRPEGGGR